MTTLDKVRASLGALTLASGVALVIVEQFNSVVGLPIAGFLIIVVGLSLLAPERVGGLFANLFDTSLTQVRANIEEASIEIEAVAPVGPEAHPAVRDSATARATEALQRQDIILQEIYTQGLAQAKASFRVSIFFSSVGAVFLLSGVALAIFYARSSGEQYASIVSGLSGVVVSMTSALFYVQSNRARTNMVTQGTSLREESQEDRRLNAARELAATIGDEKLRDTVRARIALKLHGADADTVGYRSDDLVQMDVSRRQDARLRAEMAADLLGMLVNHGFVAEADMNDLARKQIVDELLRPSEKGDESK